MYIIATVTPVLFIVGTLLYQYFKFSKNGSK
jgi:hypothetical protein